MRNFQKLGDVNVQSLLHEIQRQPELWNENKLRTEHPETAHAQADDIWLRFNDISKFNETKNPSDIIDQHESINYPSYFKLPSAKQLIVNLMSAVGGERLGRVLITRLSPGKRITPHIDSGDHAEYYDRYHITLQSLPGANFRCGNEQVNMKQGEVWWFDNSIEHEVINNSIDDRLTMIVDIRTTHEC